MHRKSVRGRNITKRKEGGERVQRGKVGDVESILSVRDWGQRKREGPSADGWEKRERRTEDGNNKYREREWRWGDNDRSIAAL